MNRPIMSAGIATMLFSAVSKFNDNPLWLYASAASLTAGIVLIVRARPRPPQTKR